MHSFFFFIFAQLSYTDNKYVEQHNHTSLGKKKQADAVENTYAN
jgi:hypothetical protein